MHAPDAADVSGMDRQSSEAYVLASIAVVIAVLALAVALMRDSGSNRTSSTAVTATTMGLQRMCEAKIAALNLQMRVLTEERAAVDAKERKLRARLFAEKAAHSPNLGSTDAAHQEAMRQQSGIEEQILGLDQQRSPGPGLCPYVTPSTATP